VAADNFSAAYCRMMHHYWIPSWFCLFLVCKKMLMKSIEWVGH